MKSILFVLDHKLHHYRAPLFDRLGQYFNVVVCHRGPMLAGSYKFTQTVLHYYSVGPFEFVRRLGSLDNYDAVVFMQNLRILNIYSAPFCRKKAALLFWGIGTSSASGLGSESWVSVQVRNLVMWAYNGTALYSEFPLTRYWKVCREKVSIVGNSVVSDGVDTSSEYKEYFLFIGSLDKRKGLDLLLDSFNAAVSINKDLKLLIAGGGPELSALQQMVNRYGLQDCVHFLGPVYDSELKLKLFKKAFCVISPLQAGLSVVESFSYGVPFVTSSRAISGGESMSIKDGVNGVLFEDSSELSDIILSFKDGRRSSAMLGRSAYCLYREELAFDFYVQRFKSFLDKNI